MTFQTEQSGELPENRAFEASFTEVRKALTGLNYGSVSITVHDGRVVQIDVTEKKRIKPD